jgi:hypothetical protein
MNQFPDFHWTIRQVPQIIGVFHRARSAYMTSSFVPDLQEIRRVPAGVALRLSRHPKDRELLVFRGRAWITLTTPARHVRRVAPQDDQFIAAGERLRVPAGAALVVKASGVRGEAVAFGWQPLIAQRVRGDLWAAQRAHCRARRSV